MKTKTLFNRYTPAFASLLLAAVLFTGCVQDAKESVQNGNFTVEFLFEQNGCNMKNLIIICSIFIIIPIILGIYAGCCGTKFIHNKERKEELLNSHLKLIKEGNVIQGFPHNGWSVSYYPTANRDWFYPKIYDFFYKWSVYYNFKWFDKC